MPISTFTGYETALSGLETEQLAIDTTGQNIDNASAPGYSEEAVTLDASTPLDVEAGSSSSGGEVQLGTGVDADTITRVRNQFLDVQYRAANTTLGSATQLQTTLTQAQSAFDEPTTNGLSSSMSKFYDDWSSLADSPASSSAGTTLVANASSLASQFNSLSAQLTTVQTQAGQQLADLTAPGGQLQSDADQISQLNGQISEQLGAGQSPNTLEDQRDSLLDDLSSLGTTSVTDESNGMVTVSFGGNSTPLINGTTAAINAGTAVNGGTWPPPTPTAATGGQLGALASLSDTSAAGAISPYITQLNTVASDLISTVNGITDASTSANPYDFFSGTTAANIAVAAGTTASTVTTAGDSSVALAVAQIAGSTADTPDSTYDALIAQVGADVQSANDTQTNAQAISTAVENQRESVSGVSLDQETTNLLAQQRGYQAAATVLNTMNAVLTTLLTAVGG